MFTTYGEKKKKGREDSTAIKIEPRVSTIKFQPLFMTRERETTTGLQLKSIVEMKAKDS